MRTIFYGVNGEGLGHLSRTLAVVDYLPEYEVHIFTYGKALKFLLDMGYPFVHEIEGVVFRYKNGHVDYLRSGLDACKYFFFKISRNISKIKSLASVLQPVLYITDYEPCVARVAEKGKLISLDNQHRFMCCHLSELSWSLRLYAALTGVFTRILVPYFDHAIISAFHYDCVEVIYDNVSLVEGLVRKSAEGRVVSNDGFVLAYLRPSISDLVLKSLLPLSREVRVYGAVDSEIKSQCGDNFKFLPLSQKFVDDLVSCDCIISTSGHQLLTEARFFGKSILTIPEPMQYEQYINAEYAEKIGFGIKCYAKNLSTEVVESFLEKTLVHTRVANGVYKVRELLDSFLVS